MPWKSDAQRRWGNSPAGHKALGDAGVAEWNHATKGKSLPAKLAQGGPTMPMPSFQLPGAPGQGGGAAPSGGGGRGMGPATGTVTRPPAAEGNTPGGGYGPGGIAGGAGMSQLAGSNKGYQGSPVRMANGGPVLGRTRSFMKTPDEFTGGRMPTKQTAPAKQDYGSKGAEAKRTGDKSLSAVKPRK